MAAKLPSSGFGTIAATEMQQSLAITYFNGYVP